VTGDSPAGHSSASAAVKAKIEASGGEALVPSARAYFWIFAILSCVLVLAPLRTGDLAGYDDALYAHIAKDIVRTGNWLNPQSNGYPALEHPPLLPWTEAAIFSVFGISDALARLPSALCGLGTILLVFWLARRLMNDSFSGVVAMFVMASSIYFLKYAARAMTDVPFTFLFLCAVAAWLLAEEDRKWYLVAGLFTGLALMTRGMMGFGLPVIFGLHAFVSRRRPPISYAAAGLAIAVLPLALWYAHMIRQHGDWFFSVHSAWLDREVYGSLSPAWRRYTGAFEYAWFLAKSYWPWLPFMLFGLVTVIRNRNRRLFLLVIWTAVVFLMCAAARSRVLRYMLPAYPAFSILAMIGILKISSEQLVRKWLMVLTPVLAVGVVAMAVLLKARPQAAEIRPIAQAATAVTSQSERVAFYDQGQPRFDETNQMQWYGQRYLHILLKPEELDEALRTRRARVFVVDRVTFNKYFNGQIEHSIVAESGHLVCLRLT
jgi:4-amino-4-deoxy-L-arabinose transferase-like glycosyltransferase